MGTRDDNAQLRRNEAWERWLKSRLNVIYLQRIIDRNNRKVKKITAGTLVFGASGTVAAKLLGQPWVLSGIPVAVGVVCQLLRAPISEKANARAELTLSRWSDLRHDSERVWKAGEKLGWGSHKVEKELLQLREREKVFDSLDTERPDRAVLHDSQRDLWKELGVQYDSP